MAVRLRRAVSGLGCAVCFQGADSPLLDGARLGVLTMAIVLVAVLGAFGAWFVKLAKREQAAGGDE